MEGSCGEVINKIIHGLIKIQRKAGGVTGASGLRHNRRKLLE